MVIWTRLSRAISTAPKVLFYALGGGRGHATRAAVLASWLPAEVEFRIILPQRLATPDQFPVSETDLGAQVQGCFKEWQPDLLLVDVFPRGVLGELAALEFPCPAWLVSRWVCSDYFHRSEVMGALSRYEEILGVERCNGPVTQDLGPVVESPSPSAPQCNRLLLLGSGPLQLQREQASILEDLAPNLGLELQIASAELGLYCPRPLEVIASASLVVSAAGYNSYAQIVQSGRPVVWWPQKRLYDDQGMRSRGELGLACRAWHRVVTSSDQLVQAVREWNEQRPRASPVLSLASPQRFAQRVKAKLGLTTPGPCGA